MTLPLHEQHKNDGITTLNGAINNSVTSITVTDGSKYPSTGNFRLMVDSEILLCTVRSSNTLTVLRGQDGTSAASHSDLAPINMIYSTQGLTRLFQDADPLFGYASRKPVNGLWDTDGKTILTASDFTFNNQGGAAKTDENGTILLTCSADSGRALRLLERTPPATPYTFIGAFRTGCVMDSASSPFFGMSFRETSSSKLMLVSLGVNNFFNWRPESAVQRWSDSNTRFTTNLGGHIFMLTAPLVWIKIENDGSNLKWYWSADGHQWVLYLSESKTAWFSSGPDRVGFFGCNEANASAPGSDYHVRLVHWSKGE